MHVMTSNHEIETLTPMQNKPYLLEETIAVTPVPQATSTVDRRIVFNEERSELPVDPKVDTNQLITAVEHLNNMVDSAKKLHKQISPTRSEDCSSLGLLDSSLSDFSVAGDVQEMMNDLEGKTLNLGLSSTNQDQNAGRNLYRSSRLDSLQTSCTMSDMDADLHLRLQRALAQSVLDRSNEFNITQDSSFESRCLEGKMEHDDAFSDCKDDEWTHRISNMMNELVIEPSGNNSLQQSLALKSKDSGISSTPTEENIYEALPDMEASSDRHSMQSTSTKIITENPFSGSDIGLNEDLQSVFHEYASEEFISADQVIDKLKADEIEWRKEFADLSACSVQGQTIDLSCFSGIIGDAEISLRSTMIDHGVMKRKVKPEEYFALKTENIGSLHQENLNDSERPNFGIKIQSPASGRQRVQLVDVTINEGISNDEVAFQEVNETKEETFSCSPSLTAIYDMLTDESPRTIASNIMSYQTKLRKKAILKDSSNCNSQTGDRVQKSSKNKASIASDSRKMNDGALKHEPKLVCIESASKNVNVKMNTDPGPFPVITIDDDSDDLKENTSTSTDSSVQILQNNINSIMSSASNKYGYDSSEDIEFECESGSEKTDIKDSTLTIDSSNISEPGFPSESWINIVVHSPELPVHVGVQGTALFSIKNTSNRWLHCDYQLENILWDRKHGVDSKNLARIIFPEKVPLLKPSQLRKDELMLQILVEPLVHGQLTVVTNIRLKDMVTKNVKNVPCLFRVVGIAPKIRVLLHEEPIDDADFGTLPENCSLELSLSIINGIGRSLELPLNLTLQQASKHKTFFLTSANVPVSKTFGSKKKLLTSIQHCFRRGMEQPFIFKIVFNAPNLAQFVSADFMKFSANLVVSLDVPSPETLILKKMFIQGRVGRSKLLIASQSPVVLSTRWPGQTISKALPIKNNGVVPLPLDVKILNPSTVAEVTDNIITVDRPELTLQPSEEDSIQIIFCPDRKFSSPLERTLMLAVQPNGEMFEVTVVGKVSNEVMSDEGKVFQPTDILSNSLASSAGSVGGTRMPSLGSESSSSGRSSRNSSEKSVATTQKQLVWGSVPLGKSQTESCSLRNELSSSIKLLMTVHDPTNSYKLLNELGEAVVQRKITLHSLECTTFTVVFSPLKCGAAFGKIKFREISSRTNGNKLAIPLFGFGGSMKFSIRDVVRDKTGHMSLNLGQLDGTMHSHFKVINKGNLDAFAIIKHMTRGIGPLLQPSVTVKPSQFIVEAGSSIPIDISYHLPSEDLKFLMKDEREVIEVGMLCITYGDEPTRHRLRRIKEKQTQTTSKDVLTKAYEAFSLEKLCAPFPGEHVIDINSLNDPESSLQFLYRTLQQQEVALTVEKLGDKSFAMQTYIGGGDAASQSLLFKTMLDDNTTFTCPIDESDVFSDGTWNILPSSLTLMVPDVLGGCITISSKFKDDQMFEAHSSEKFLSVHPASGIVPSMGEAIIMITCSASLLPKDRICKATLQIYMENDVKSVPINIKNIPQELSQGLQRLPKSNVPVHSGEQTCMASKSSLHTRTDSPTHSNKSPPRKLNEASSQRKSKRHLPLHCDSYNIEFRKTAVGSASVGKCILKNESPCPLQVNISNVNSPFTTQRTSMLIKGNELVILKIYFQPSAAILYKQDMILSSEGYIPLNISLSGEGVIRS